MAKKFEWRGQSEFVYGKVQYKGRYYWWVGRPEGRRGVAPVKTRDGRRCLLAFRDGSKSFWVDRERIEVVKVYQRPYSIKELLVYAEDAKNGRTCGRCGGRNCNADRRCYMCGCGRCEGAFGGTCDLD